MHAFAFSIAALLGPGVPAFAAEWQFTPNSRVTSGYTGNPRFLAEGGDDELQNGAEIGALLNSRTERLQLSIVPRATFSRFQSDETLDTNNQYLGMTSAWQTERVLWKGNAQFTHDSTQTSELGTTGLIQGNSRRELAAVGAGGTWTVYENFSSGANVQWNDVHYADAESSGLEDYSRSSASLFATAAISDRTKLTLSAQGGRLESASRSQPTTDSGLTLGLNHTLGPQWSLSVAAGPSWADSGLETLQGTLYSADVTRQGELTQFAAGVSRRLEPVGTGFLTLSEAFTLSVTRRMTETLSVMLSGQATRYRELFNDSSAGGRDTRYAGATGSLNWNFARAWALSLSVEQRYQEVVSTVNEGAADSYRFWLGISWTGRTLML